MKLAISYCRVSTAKQVEDGVSLDMQRREIERWCSVRQLTLSESYADEGVSGKSMAKRPGFRAALDAACRLKAVLVVYDLNRASRSFMETFEIADRLHKAGAGLASVTENIIDTTSPMGEFVFGMLALLGQLERKRTAQRTREASAFVRTSGMRFTRHAPLGMKWVEDGVHPDGTKRAGKTRWKMVEDPRGAVKRDAIRGMLSVGKSLGETARTLGVSLGTVRGVKRSMV